MILKNKFIIIFFVLFSILINKDVLADEYTYDTFSVLRIDTMYLEPSLSDIEYDEKKADLANLRKLAIHISNKFGKDLGYVESVVWQTYLESKKQKVEYKLLLAIIGVESGFYQFSKSGAGAIGLTQVIPRWHPEKIKNIKREEGTANIWSIPHNIAIGTQVLREYFDSSNDNLLVALQKYNGALHDRNKKYAKKVLAMYYSLKRAEEY